MAPAACARRMNSAAGANQAFLVGERHRRAALDRGQRRLQAGRAADRRHHPVGRTLRRLRPRLRAGRRLDAGARQRVLEFAIELSDRRPPRTARRQLARQSWRAPRHSCARSPPRRDSGRLALEQIDRAGADRAGRTENSDVRCATRLASTSTELAASLTIPAVHARDHRSRRAQARSDGREARLRQ